MQQLDFSRELYDTYYNPKGKLLSIKLNDGTIHEGIFIGFFHGEQDRHEPFIIMWRFVQKDEIDDFNYSPYKYQEYGRIIHQKDIASVHFL